MHRRIAEVVLLFVPLLNCGSSTAMIPPPPPPPPSSPPASVGHALVFHAGLGAVILVNAGLGGMSSPSSGTKTVLWRWNGQVWSVLDSLGPPVRNIGGVAYDSDRGELVLFGGSYDQNLVYDETWIWTQQAGWQQRRVPGPGKRDHTQMAYDPAQKRVVLFGGQQTTTSFPSDTWLWDGQRWAQVAAAPNGPGTRVHHTLTYDPVMQRVLLFGGYNPTGLRDLGDTWAWSGDSWTRAAADIAARTHATIGATSQGVQLIGGMPSAASPMLLETGGWITVTQSGPGARYMTAMAYDPTRQVTVLFGGGDSATDQPLADTWEYHVTTGWRRIP